MNIAEKLKQERENKIVEHALEFVESIEPELKKSAAEGYTGYAIGLEGREDAHILKALEFQRNVELLLEGCKVTIQKNEYKNLLFNNTYFKYKLNISWN